MPECTYVVSSEDGLCLVKIRVCVKTETKRWKKETKTTLESKWNDCECTPSFTSRKLTRRITQSWTYAADTSIVRLGIVAVILPFSHTKAGVEQKLCSLMVVMMPQTSRQMKLRFNPMRNIFVEDNDFVSMGSTGTKQKKRKIISVFMGSCGFCLEFTQNYARIRGFSYPNWMGRKRARNNCIRTHKQSFTTFIGMIFQDLWISFFQNSMFRKWFGFCFGNIVGIKSTQLCKGNGKSQFNLVESCGGSI